MSNKLLLADDSITIQKVVGIIFANEDYELTVVDNGDAALEKARQIVPDIILVDALMPGKTGYEVCTEVRRDPKLKTIPLLLLTGAFEPFDEDKAKQSGADDFISKPFESQQLIDRVQKLIELGKSRSVAVKTEVPVEAPPAEPVAAQPPVAAKPEAVAAQAPAQEDEVFSLGEEAIEGSIDDDLWGAFEIEDVGEDGAIDFGAVVEPPSTPQPPPAVEISDAFSFADVDDELAEGVVETPEEKAPEAATAWDVDEQVVTEEVYNFQEEEVSELSVETGAPSALSEFECAPEAADVEPEMDHFLEEAVAPAEEYTELAQEPVAETLAAAEIERPSTEPPAPATQAASGQPVSLSETQIREALAGLSREIIEKIVWEVVPDLAEILIKEEIKKLKTGTEK